VCLDKFISLFVLNCFSDISNRFSLFTNYNEAVLSCADLLLGDFLVAENSPLQPVINERGSPLTSPKHNQSNFNYNAKTPSMDGGLEIPSSGGSGYVICCFFR